MSPWILHSRPRLITREKIMVRSSEITTQQTAALLLPEWALWRSPRLPPASQVPHRWAPLSLEAEWSWPRRTITVSSVMPPLVPRPWLRLTTKGRTTPRGCGWQKHRVTHSRRRQRLGHGGAGKKGMTIKWCRIGEAHTRFRIIQVLTSTPARGKESHGIWPCALLQVASSIAPCATWALARRWNSGSTWRASSIKARCQSSATGTRWRTWAMSSDSRTASSVACGLLPVTVSCVVVLWSEYIPPLPVNLCSRAGVLWDVTTGKGKEHASLGPSLGPNIIFRLATSSYLLEHVTYLPCEKPFYLDWVLVN